MQPAMQSMPLQTVVQSFQLNSGVQAMKTSFTSCYTKRTKEISYVVRPSATAMQSGEQTVKLSSGVLSIRR